MASAARLNATNCWHRAAVRPKTVVGLRVVAFVAERSKESNQHPPPSFYDSVAVVVVEVLLFQATELIVNANQPVSGSEFCLSPRRS